MRTPVLFAALTLFGLCGASAQITDPDMTCAAYLDLVAKMGPTPKTGDAATDKMAADLDAKIKTYCTANPKAKVTEAAEKAMTGG
jgi:hypothetical protein